MKQKVRCPKCHAKIDIEVKVKASPRVRVLAERLAPKMDARLGKEPDFKIASEMGVSVTVVRHRRISLGIPTYQESYFAERRALLQSMLAKGMTLEECGKSMGMTRQGVRELIKRIAIVDGRQRMET